MIRRSLLVIALVAAGACGTSPTDSIPAVSRPDSTSQFQWRPDPDDDRVELGSIAVPMDWNDPTKGVFQLEVARHLAKPGRRVGSLLVNPGGPGFGGTDYAIDAENIYSPALLDRFDIVGWDPRGTGRSRPPIDCIDDYDRYFTGIDITPDTDAERQQAVDVSKEFADACIEKNGESLPYVGTNNSARDIDYIRRGLQESTISYFGFSYGSELGATWATLFPTTVRAAVLDGAVDPTADFLESGLQQTAGFEQALTTFLARCSGDDTCAFHHDGDAEGAFDTLMLTLDETPIPTTPGRPDLTRGMALNGVSQAMYSESLWPTLEEALAAAELGDGTPLLQLHDDYFQRQPDGSYGNELEAFQAIECQDNTERPTVEEDDATAAQFRAVAPRFAPGTIGGYFCTFFPPSIDPSAPITGAGAGPILVMGTTGDPATPLSGTERMADTLENGRLVVVEAEGHTGYGANSCSVKVIDEYLIDPVGKAPADGTRCA
jgi:pimeloyl-ACP methyl ester carboxylesterase